MAVNRQFRTGDTSFPRRRESRSATTLDSRLRGNDGLDVDSRLRGNGGAGSR